MTTKAKFVPPELSEPSDTEDEPSDSEEDEPKTPRRKKTAKDSDEEDATKKVRAKPLATRLANVLDAKELKTILSLKYKDTDEHILKDRDGSLAMEVMGLIKALGFTEAVKFLRGCKARDNVLWDNPTLQDEKLIDESLKSIQMNKNRGLIVDVNCGKCGGKKATMFRQQVRRSDEPMTEYYSCVTCPNSWRIG